MEESTQQVVPYENLPKRCSNVRALRNQAEKMRRDKFNSRVTELANIVPFVMAAQKKVDKISVLRLAAAYLRLNQVLHGTDAQKVFSDPSYLNVVDSSRSLLNSVGGFLLVVGSGGKIIFASEAVEDTFGYSQADILGHSFYNLVHSDDRKLVKSQLQPRDNRRRNFYCRMVEKGVPRLNAHRYEIVRITGTIKELPGQLVNMDQYCVHTKMRRSRKNSRHRSDSESGSGDSSPFGTDLDAPVDIESGGGAASQLGTHMLVAYVEVVRDRPITQISWVESLRDEYITRHKMDGSIVYVDHRISFLTGLMPTEVIGDSAFRYMHQDDVLWSIAAQKRMLSDEEGQGVVTYRLVTKNGLYICLRSKGFLEVNKDTGKVDTFVCINTMLGEKEAKTELQKQRKELLPLFKATSPDEMLLDIVSNLPPSMLHIVETVVGAKNSFGQMIRNIDAIEIDKDEIGEPLKLQDNFTEPINTIPVSNHPKLNFSPDPEGPLSPLDDGERNKRENMTKRNGPEWSRGPGGPVAHSINGVKEKRGPYERKNIAHDGCRQAKSDGLRGVKRVTETAEHFSCFETKNDIAPINNSPRLNPKDDTFSMEDNSSCYPRFPEESFDIDSLCSDLPSPSLEEQNSCLESNNTHFEGIYTTSSRCYSFNSASQFHQSHLSAREVPFRSAEKLFCQSPGNDFDAMETNGGVNQFQTQNFSLAKPTY